MDGTPLNINDDQQRDFAFECEFAGIKSQALRKHISPKAVAAYFDGGMCAAAYISQLGDGRSTKAEYNVSMDEALKLIREHAERHNVSPAEVVTFYDAGGVVAAMLDAHGITAPDHGQNVLGVAAQSSPGTPAAVELAKKSEHA